MTRFATIALSAALTVMTTANAATIVAVPPPHPPPCVTRSACLKSDSVAECLSRVKLTMTSHRMWQIIVKCTYTRRRRDWKKSTDAFVACTRLNHEQLSCFRFDNGMSGLTLYSTCPLSHICDRTTPRNCRSKITDDSTPYVEKCSS